MPTWPEDFFQFAFVPETAEQLKALADEAEPEDWGYHYTPSDHPYPVLYNYVRYTYRRVAEEAKIVLSEAANSRALTPAW